MTDLKKATVALKGADLERRHGPELQRVIRDHGGHCGPVVEVPMGGAMSGSSEEIACRFAEYTKGMAPEDKARCLDLFKQFIRLYRNSETFKKRCEKLVTCRISPLEEWFRQHHFEG
jgi:hypothetical protein